MKISTKGLKFITSKLFTLWLSTPLQGKVDLLSKRAKQFLRFAANMFKILNS